MPPEAEADHLTDSPVSAVVLLAEQEALMGGRATSTLTESNAELAGFVQVKT